MAANSFFDWVVSTVRFVPRDTARAEDVNSALDEVSNGFTDVEVKTDAAIKLQDGETAPDLGSAAARKGTVLSFNASTGAPEASITTGDIATVAGSIANVNTVGANIASVNTTAANIASVNTAVANIAAINAAPTEASNAAASAALAEDWAIQTGAPVSGGEWSAKSHSITAGVYATNASNSADAAAASAASIDVAAYTHAAASKTTPVDADEIPLSDSAATWGLKKLTWANLKTALATTFQKKTADAELFMNSFRIRGIKSVHMVAQYVNTTTTGASTIDWGNGNHQKQDEPTGAITYTFTAPLGVCHLQLLIDSDGTSSAFTHVFPGNVIWMGATWAQVANKKAIINFWYDGTNYYAMGVNQV